MERFVIYARKSSESEEKQVQSIEDQLKELDKLVARQGLKVVARFTESKTGKMPYIRPQFRAMMDMVRSGKADSILCWHIDRLSRNPIDSGEVSWLLLDGTMKSILTPARTYTKHEAGLLMSIEAGIATQFSIDQSNKVSRGMAGKRERGGYPHVPPAGWLNDRIERTIVIDPERFQLIRQAWDLLLTGTYAVPGILEILNKKWGYRTRLGNKPLGITGLYKIFNNQFYMGAIVSRGVVVNGQGNHRAMITPDEFDRAQEILGRKGKPRPKKHEFAFAGIIRCAECGSVVSWEEKTKFVKKLNAYGHYSYCHCSHKQDRSCSQRKCVKRENIEQQIIDVLSGMTILPEFQEWALEGLRNRHEIDRQDRATVYKSQVQALGANQKALDDLLDYLLRKVIEEPEYERKRNILLLERARLQGSRNNTEKTADESRELNERVWSFATYAKAHFESGDIQKQKEILEGLGQNFLLRDGKVALEQSPWIVPIKKGYPKLEARYKELALAGKLSGSNKTALLEPLISRWWSWGDSHPRPENNCLSHLHT